MPDDKSVEALAALHRQFPGWRVRLHPRGRMPWEAHRLDLRPPGGIVHLVASEPGHLRDLLMAATAINTRHLGLLS